MVQRVTPELDRLAATLVSIEDLLAALGLDETGAWRGMQTG